MIKLKHKTIYRAGSFLVVLGLSFMGLVPQAHAEIRSDCPTLDNCKIIQSYLIPFINVLSAVAGVVIVIMIVVGAIQYTSARDNPQAVSAARDRIMNAILALFMLMGTVAFLQWLVPGGIFSG